MNGPAPALRGIIHFDLRMLSMAEVGRPQTEKLALDRYIDDRPRWLPNCDNDAECVPA